MKNQPFRIHLKFGFPNSLCHPDVGNVNFIQIEFFHIFTLSLLIISEIATFATNHRKLYGDHIISIDLFEIKSILLSRWELKIYLHMKILPSDSKGEMTTG